MGYLFGCTAAFLWGLKPGSIKIINGKAIQVQFGTACGVLLFSIIVFFATFSTSYADLTSSLGLQIILYSFFSGACWAIGQFFQFYAYKLLSTSIGFALTTAFTLIFNAAFSVIVFKDWQTPFQLGLGFGAIFTIIIGSLLTIYRSKETKTKSKDTKNNLNLIIGIIVSIITGLFFMLYSGLLRFVTIQNVSTTSTLLPHGIGTFLGTMFAILIQYILEIKQHKKDDSYQITSLKDIKVVYSIIPGLLSSGGNFLMIITNSLIGSAVGFTLTQMAVVISTLISLFLLKEYKNKTKTEIIFTCIGAVIILAGGVMIGFTK